MAQADDKEHTSKITACLEKFTFEDWSELADIYMRVKNRKSSFSPDDTVLFQLRNFFYSKGLVLPFDWANWHEGRAMVNKQGEDKYNKLSQAEVVKLFTAFIRNDRFCEGSLAGIFNSGDALKLLDRLLATRPAVYWLIENLHNTKLGK